MAGQISVVESAKKKKVNKKLFERMKSNLSPEEAMSNELFCKMIGYSELKDFWFKQGNCGDLIPGTFCAWMSGKSPRGKHFFIAYYPNEKETVLWIETGMNDLDKNKIINFLDGYSEDTKYSFSSGGKYYMHLWSKNNVSDEKDLKFGQVLIFAVEAIHSR